MSRLANDECCIGKIPNVTDVEYAEIFESWKPNAAGVINWEMFREGMNNWKWRMVDRDHLEEVINDFFA